jgi:apolipoprotein N-acyltransferase
MNTVTTDPAPGPQNLPDIYTQASRRAGAKMGWIVHALVYLAVNGGLALLSFLSLHGARHGAAATALGWGFALLVHGLVVYAAGPGSRLRESLVQAEVKRLQSQRDPW